MLYNKIRDDVSVEPRWSTTLAGLECRYLVRDVQTNWYAWITQEESVVAMGLRYIENPSAELICDYAKNRHFLDIATKRVDEIYSVFQRYGFVDNRDDANNLLEKKQIDERKRVYDQMQLEKLQDVVDWTFEKSSYYAATFGKVFNGRPPKFVTLEDIKLLPKLPKAVFRSEMPNLPPKELEMNRKAFPTSWATSSGTSGNRVQTLTDPQRQKRFVSDCTWQFIADTLPTNDITKCCVLTTPVCSGTACHMDIKRPLSERLISDGRRLILNSYLSPAVASDDDLAEIVSDIQTFRPNVLRGAASYILPLARYVQRKQIKLPHFDYVILGWELNSRIHVRALEHVFGCRVIDEWGATEMMPIATKCKNGNFHIADEHLVEIVREGVAVEEGEVGQILVTSLKRHATPLIRYEIGDLARAGSAQCACGHPAPIFANIEGRIRDVIYRTNGEPITPREVDNVVSGEVERGGIEYYSLIQKAKKSFVFRYVPAAEVVANFEADLDYDLKNLLGSDAVVIFEAVKEIFPSNSGKFRLSYRDGYESEYSW